MMDYKQAAESCCEQLCGLAESEDDIVMACEDGCALAALLERAEAELEQSHMQFNADRLAIADRDARIERLEAAVSNVYRYCNRQQDTIGTSSCSTRNEYETGRFHVASYVRQILDNAALDREEP